jgi:hypothetical protein
MTIRQQLLWTVFAVVFLFAALTGLVGCGGSSPRISPESSGENSRPLVESRVGVGLSTGQVGEFLNANRYKLSGGTLTADTVRQIIDSILIDTLAGLAAQEIDLSTHRLPYRDFVHQYQDALIRKWTDVAIRGEVSAYDSAEVLTFFNSNPGRFMIDEQIKVLQILISGYGLLVGPDSSYYKNFTNVELREKAKEQIFQVYELLKFGEAFENLALVFNQDVTTRDNAGLVGWVKRETYIDPFDSVAFGLKVGEFSKPYLDKDGWHIVKVDGHLPAGQLPIDTPGVFEYARQTLLSDKLAARAAKVTDSLRIGLKLELNPAIGDSNIYRVDDETWAGVINGRDTVKAYVLKYYEEGMKGKYRVDSSDAAMKLEMLGLAADRYLTVRAVENRGLNNDTDVVNFKEGLRFAKCKQLVLNGQYDFNWTPSDSMLRAYYEAHKSEYEVLKPTTLQYMTVGDSTFASFLHDQAITGLDLPQIAGDFASTNPGGVLKVSEVMTVGANDIPFPIWQAAVLTAAGGVSSTIKHDGNYVFVKVLSRRESRNFALAKGEILVKLQKEHQRRVYENFRDNLYKRYGVKFVGKIEAVTLQPYWIRNQKS